MTEHDHTEEAEPLCDGHTEHSATVVSQEDPDEHASIPAGHGHDGSDSDEKHGGHDSHGNHSGHAGHSHGGVLLGVAAAVAVHVWREMHVVVPASVEEDVLHLRPTGVLYFGSAPAVERTLTTLITEHPDVSTVVLHLDRVGRLDLTGALMLRDILEEAEAAGRALRIEGAGAHAPRLLTRVLGIPVAEPGWRS